MLVKKGFVEKYCSYIKQNPNSMLTRFYGIYKIKIKYMKPISIVVMDNLMGLHPEELEATYDLKGSTF